MPNRDLFLCSLDELCLLRCSNRASSFASAAVNASVRINNILAVTLRNSSYGAAVSASAASDAIIRNLICHNKIPPKTNIVHNYTYTF